MKFKPFSFHRITQEFKSKLGTQNIVVTCNTRRMPEISSSMRLIEEKQTRGEMPTFEDWLVIIAFVQRGAERQGKRPNYELLLAFRSVFEIRARCAKDARLSYYLGNLPEQCQPRSLVSGPITPNTVRRVIALTLAVLLCDEAATLWPLLPARNLRALLEYEPLESLEALNKALLPHWGMLWKLAASVAFKSDEVRQ